LDRCNVKEILSETRNVRPLLCFQPIGFPASWVRLGQGQEVSRPIRGRKIPAARTVPIGPATLEPMAHA
jgi:hypothetical protein